MLFRFIIFIILFSTLNLHSQDKNRVWEILDYIADDEKYYLQGNYFSRGEINIDPRNDIEEYHAKKGVAVQTISGNNLKNLCLPVYDQYSEATQVGYCAIEIGGKRYKVPILYSQGDKKYTLNHPREIRVPVPAPSGTPMAAPAKPPAESPKVSPPPPVRPTPSSSAPRVVTPEASTTPAARPSSPGARAQPRDNNTSGGLDSYLYSQLPCDADKEKYTNFIGSYGNDLEEASEIFNIPKTYLTCLIFKESKFDVDARSGTGARGLGQILRIASREGMRFYVLGSKISEDKIKEIRSEMERLRDQIKKSKNPIALKNRLEELALEEGYYKMYQMWKSYANRLQAEGKIKNRYIAVPKYVSENYSKYKASNEDVRNLNLLNEVYNPHIAIGITSAYLKTIQSKYDIENDDTRITQENYKKFIIDAGAYNAGDSALNRAQSSCASSLGAEISNDSLYVSCLYRVIKTTNSQANSYTQSIENCIRSEVGEVNGGYLSDIKGTEIDDDVLSRNQTETDCFSYGAQLINHKFSRYFSCNDVTKVKGLYGTQSGETNTCRNDLPPDASKDLKYIDSVFKRRNIPRDLEGKSVIHRIGTDRVCTKKVKNAKGKETLLTTCKVGRCPTGYTEGAGFYATMSAPNEFLQCPRSIRNGRPGRGGR